MKLTLISNGPLRGSVNLPGDKSISHRAILLGALAEGESRIRNVLVAGVTRVMLDALKELGVIWELEGTDLTIQGIGLNQFQVPTGPLYCGNSGTTMRLLAGALAGRGMAAVLDGSEGLRKRPMGRIINPLKEMGVNIEGSPKNTAPLILGKHQEIKGIQHELKIASAQVKSAILLAGLGADGETRIIEPGPSRDHTERMLRSMGLMVEVDGFKTALKPVEKLMSLDMTIPGDISSAAFIIAAALTVPDSDVKLENVGLNPTRTGLLDVLKDMGGKIEIINQREENNEAFGDVIIKYSELSPIEIGGDTVVRMIDEFLAFGVVAAYAKGETIVRNAKELRYKETDRIALLCQEFELLGIDIEEREDGFLIRGGKGLEGGPTQSHGDHRIAMALSLLGLGDNKMVTVDGAEIIQESFPSFGESMKELGVGVLEE